MTFNEFLRSLPPMDNPRGDFIKDASRDDTWPDVRSLEDIYDYLHSRGAVDGCTEAAYRVWAAFIYLENSGSMLDVEAATIADRLCIDHDVAKNVLTGGVDLG